MFIDLSKKKASGEGRGKERWNKKRKKGYKDERQDEGGWRLNGYATKVTKM